MRLSEIAEMQEKNSEIIKFTSPSTMCWLNFRHRVGQIVFKTDYGTEEIYTVDRTDLLRDDWIIKDPDINPCKLCNSYPAVSEKLINNNDGKIECLFCGITVSPTLGDTEESVISRWNSLCK